MKNEKLNTFKNLIKIIKFIYKTTPILFIINIIFYILLAFTPLLNLVIMKEVVNLVVDIIQNKGSISKGILLLLVQTLISILTWSAGSVHKLIEIKMKQKIDFSLQKIIIQKANSLPLVFFDDHESYNKVERASAAGDRATSILNAILEIFKNLITLTGYLVMLYSLHWILPVSIILLIFIPLWVNIRIGQQKYNQAYEQTPTQRRISYLYNLLIGKHAAKELRLSKHDNYLSSLWEKLIWKNNTEQFNLEKRAVKSNLWVFSVKDISNLIFISSILYISSKGRLTMGDYFIFSQGITFSLSMINEIAQGISSIFEGAIYINDYYYFINQEEEKLNAYLINPLIFKKEIKVENLSFQYPHSNRKTLDNISFEIKCGEKIAIVGKNGAGKSTLINCIIGLYKTTEGKIFYDGVHINQINPLNLRKKISAIFQDFVRYQLSIRKNICISDIENIDNDEKINRVVKETDIDSLIEKLIHGYETELGTAFSGGQELSGGQWQKIGLTRALFKDSEIIILDEPTAALDPIAESDILSKFIKSTKDKTSIFITHRLGICKEVDRIIVLDNGRLIEQGNHNELMTLKGEYANMFKSQSDWYH